MKHFFFPQTLHWSHNLKRRQLHPRSAAFGYGHQTWSQQRWIEQCQSFVWTESFP